MPVSEFCCVDDIYQCASSPGTAEKHCDVIEKHLEEKLQTPPHDQWRKMSTIEKTQRLLGEVEALEQLKSIVAARKKRRRELASACDEAVSTPPVSLWTRRKRMRRHRSRLSKKNKKNTHSNSSLQQLQEPRINRSCNDEVGERLVKSDQEKAEDEVLRIRPPNVNVLLIAQESLVNRCNKLHLRKRRGSFSLMMGGGEGEEQKKGGVEEGGGGETMKTGKMPEEQTAETALDEWLQRTAATRIVTWLRRRRRHAVMSV